MPTPGELVQIVRDPGLLYQSINWQGRQLIWILLWGAFMTSPLWGLGLGSSTAVMREYFGEGGVDVAHNEYLRLATDTGVVGLGLFMIAMIIWLVAAIRMSRRPQLEVREFALAAAGLSVAWFVIAMTDNAINYYNNFSQYLGFLMAGAVAAQANARQLEHAAAR
jgi:O-antigen ligase